MTFEQALEKLVELYPEKKLVHLIRLWKTSLYFPSKSFGSFATQDDIDFILAEVGWVHVPILHRGQFVNQGLVTIHYTNYLLEIVPGNFYANNELQFPSKLEASKQALISVVEKIIKERESNVSNRNV